MRLAQKKAYQKVLRKLKTFDSEHSHTGSPERPGVDWTSRKTNPLEKPPLTKPSQLTGHCALADVPWI